MVVACATTDRSTNATSPLIRFPPPLGPVHRRPIFPHCSERADESSPRFAPDPSPRLLSRAPVPHEEDERGRLPRYRQQECPQVSRTQPAPSSTRLAV